MSASATLAEQITRQLLPLGPVRAKRMFGGYGVFHDDVMFGLIADGVLFLKVDEETKSHFAAAGSEPFVYSRPGKTVEMSYWRLPAAAENDPDVLLTWAERAIATAKRAKKPKKKRRSRKA